MHDLTKRVKSLENWGILMDDGIEKVKHETKIKEGRFLGTFMVLTASSLIKTVASPLINTVTEKEFMRAGKRREVQSLLFLP